MTQSNCISAYRVLETLNKNSFDGATAFKIFKLKKQLKEVYDFQAEEEQRIFEEYGARIEDNGGIVLDDMKRAQEFVQKIEEMSNVEHDEIIPVSIPANCFSNITIDDMEKLDGFIEFVE